MCRISLGLVPALALSWMLSSPVEAQPQTAPPSAEPAPQGIQPPPPPVPIVAHAFVSVNGGDDTLCGPAWPCRTFARALSIVTRGGEVVVLSSGDYEPFSITKPVSVVAAPGVRAVITATSGSAITIETLGTVVLRGLTLNGRGADTGINGVGADVLHVEDCVLDGFSGNAISFASGNLHIRDTTVRNSGFNAIYISGGFSSINRLRIEAGRRGFVADGGTIAVRNSVAEAQVLVSVWARGLNSPVDLTIENSIAGRSFFGIIAGNQGLDTDFSAPGHGARVFVSNSIVSNTTNGIIATQGLNNTGIAPKVWLSNTTIARATVAIFHDGSAEIVTRGNNTFTDNVTDGSWFTSSTPCSTYAIFCAK